MYYGNITNHFYPWMETKYMQHSRNTRDFISSLVSCYQRYDHLNKQYTLSFDDLPEYDLCKLSAMLLLDNDDIIGEIIGPDNVLFDSLLIPAMQSYLRNIDDQEEQYKLAESFKRMILAYHEKVIEELITEELRDINTQGRHEEYSNDEEDLVWAI
jgi:hypothetical protein